MTDQRDVLIHQASSGPSSDDIRAPYIQRWYRRLKQSCRGVIEFWHDDSASNPPQTAPYSRQYELKYFFRRGIPLGFSALMSFGIPQLVAMSFAGHTSHSANLQASLGFARVWYACTMQMPQIGLSTYFRTVVPGCIGADRKDRIPRYFQRSILLSLLCLIPVFFLQIFADSILHTFGIPLSHARDVGHYCRLMIITSVMNIVIIQMETAFNNLGFVHCTTLNSFICGLGIDCTCTFLFIYALDWGMAGAALARMTVASCRLTMWCILMFYYKLPSVICIAGDSREPLLPMKEIRVFMGLAIPKIFVYFAGWLIFELQMMCVANISGVTQDALAAGAIWVQLESATAAAQSGWLESTSMRTLALLGRQDPGARDGFLFFHKLAALSVAFVNFLLLLFQSGLCRAMTNDVSSQEWLGKVLWILALHTQTRISALVPLCLYIPLGRGALQFILTFVSFYVVAAPIGGLAALTDTFTESVAIKMGFCLGITTIAQLAMAVLNFIYIQKLDWHAAGLIIRKRANTDKQADSTSSIVSLPEVDEKEEA